MSLLKYLVLSHSVTFHWPKPWLNPKSKKKERYSAFLVIKTRVTEQRPGHREGRIIRANKVICCHLPSPLQLLISLSHAKYPESHLRNHKILIWPCRILYSDILWSNMTSHDLKTLSKRQVIYPTQINTQWWNQGQGKSKSTPIQKEKWDGSLVNTAILNSHCPELSPSLG